jgi:hypothetical protein
MHRTLAGFMALMGAALTFGCASDQVRYAPIGTLPPSGEPAAAVLYLVGDAGEVNAQRDAVLAHLSQDIDAAARGGEGPPVLVAFLGDNIYEEGATPDPAPEDLRKLSGQVLALPPLTNVRGVFVPGNHDWADGAGFEDGRDAIELQSSWVETMSEGRNVAFSPADGCPGPVSEDLGGVVRLVFIDTEWLLRGATDARCGSPADFYGRLTAALREGGDRPVVLLAHHPLASGGPHGGNVGLFERQPVVYYLAAKGGAMRQDLKSSAYTAMRREIAAAITASGAPPLLQAAGHDHTLQVIRMAGDGEPRYQLVSGSASKTSRVRRIEGTRYASDGFGYMRLDFRTGGVGVIVYARPVDGGPVRAVFTCTLTRSAPPTECPEAPVSDGG